MQTQLLHGRMAKCPLLSILVGVNTPKKNGNWPQQESSMKASLVSVALWEKLWGTRDMAQQVLQGEYLTGKQAGEEQNNMLK